MQRYFFHFRAQNHSYEDDDGMELPDFDAAVREALRIQNELTTGPVGADGLTLHVTDSSGETLIQVPIPGQRTSSSDRFC